MKNINHMNTNARLWLRIIIISMVFFLIINLIVGIVKTINNFNGNPWAWGYTIAAFGLPFIFGMIQYAYQTVIYHPALEIVLFFISALSSVFLCRKRLKTKSSTKDVPSNYYQVKKY